MKETRFCECCRARLDIECGNGELREKAKAVGWDASSHDYNALCGECAPRCRISTYAAGEHNSSFLIKATENGIEVMDGIATLDWEWIDEMRQRFKRP